MKQPRDLSSRSIPSCYYLSLAQTRKFPPIVDSGVQRLSRLRPQAILAYAFLWIVSEAQNQAFATRNDIHE